MSLQNISRNFFLAHLNVTRGKLLGRSPGVLARYVFEYSALHV